MGDEAEYLSAQDDLYLLYNQEHYKDTRKSSRNGLYQCSYCKVYKHKSEFYKDKRVPCGIRHRCKKCYHK